MMKLLFIIFLKDVSILHVFTGGIVYKSDWFTHFLAVLNLVSFHYRLNEIHVSAWIL